MKQLFDLDESHRNVLLSFTVADRMNVEMSMLVDNQQISQKARTLRCQAHSLSVVCRCQYPGLSFKNGERAEGVDQTLLGSVYHWKPTCCQGVMLLLKLMTS